MLVTSLAVVKSYILAGDVHQGLTFLRCSDKATKLEELSRVRHPVSFKSRYSPYSLVYTYTGTLLMHAPVSPC